MLPHAACKLLFSFPAIGRERWAAPEDVVGLAASPGEFLAPYQPAQRYLLLDVGGYTGSLPEGRNLMAGLIRLEHSRSPARCSQRRSRWQP